MENELYAALEPFGFSTAGSICYGMWKGYAVSLRPVTGNRFFAYVAVRLPKIPAGLRKTLKSAVKEPGLKLGGTDAIRKKVVTAIMTFPKGEDCVRRCTAWMDKLTAALHEQGVVPADTCAVSGSPRPDSLCLVFTDGRLCCQPVCASAVRQKADETREKAEENDVNGSYVLGFIGAVVGMLIGVILNVLGIVFTERIYAILFALVPIAAMFGYKLLKGKMSGGSVVIVIVLSLLAIFLIPMFEVTALLMREYGATLPEALKASAGLMRDTEFLSEIKGEFIQLLLFMALGIVIAWRFMKGSTNSSKVSGAEAQLATLRSDPRFTAEEDKEDV